MVSAFGPRVSHLRSVAAGVVIGALSVLTACGASWTRTPFANAIGEAAATIAAARATLSAEHAGDLSSAYAQGAFVNYREGLEGVSSELPSLDGAPRDVGQLVEALNSAASVVSEPCLANDCDWQGELDLLENAGDQLRRAAEEQG